MAENRPITPEKQLLNLIEDTKRANTPQTVSAPARLKRQGQGLLSLSALFGGLLGRISFVRRSTVKRLGSTKKRFDLGSLNKIIALITVLLAAYAIFDSVASSLALKRPPHFSPKQEKATASGAHAAQVSPLRASDYYASKVMSRDLFKGGRRVADPSSNQPAQEVTEDLSKDFTLVGISWSATPDAIIEDKAHQKTYFVKKGQAVGENARVEAIMKDRVILNISGQEFEIR